MGANIVANYLGEEGSKSFVKAAVCVQPPLCMISSHQNIQVSLRGFYNKALGQGIKRKFEPYVELLEPTFKD